jgi:hypothetical protein
MKSNMVYDSFFNHRFFINFETLSKLTNVQDLKK